MGIVAPFALAGALLAAPIIALYMLRLRREDRVVPSILIWQQITQDRAANTPWQKLRKNLLLILQLVILALLVIALARPFLPVSVPAQGSAIVLLDASASMQATDVPPSRFEAAKNTARQLIDSLSEPDTMSLVVVSNLAEVRVSATSDKNALRRAVDEAQASNSTTNMADALILAQALARQSARPTIVILSDGEFDAPQVQGGDVPIRYVPIGNSSRNVAVAALAVRDSGQGIQAFARLVNHSEQAENVTVEVLVDGVLFQTHDYRLEPKQQEGLSLTGLPPTTRVIQVRLRTDDFLAVDNAAWTLRYSGDQRRVLLVTDGNVFLKRALGLLPGIQLFEAPPGPLPEEPFDLYIFDGTVPEGFKRGNVLLINPPPGNPFMEVGGTRAQNPGIKNVRQDSPLVQNIAWQDVNIQDSAQIVPPAWSDVLVDSDQGPLLLAGELEGRRVAALSFDVHHSDFPLQVGFPILMSNLTSWLLPTGSTNLPLRLPPREVLSLRPEPGVDEVVVTRPDGAAKVFTKPAGLVTFVDTEQPGVYSVVQKIEGQQVYGGQFVVNLFDEKESEIKPRTDVAGSETFRAGDTSSAAGRQEIWRPILLGALSVALLEWLIFFRVFDQVRRRFPGWRPPRLRLRRKGSGVAS